MKLWHCPGSRSLRPLWVLEELGLDYELELLPFPPRLHCPDYLETNPLGTIPFFRDGDVEMTESVAICQYLVDRHGGHSLGVTADDSAYGDYLNWLYHADATLTFPQTVYLRYRVFDPEPGKRRAGEDYARWFRSRLRRLEGRLAQKEWLAADRFTIADIACGYALHLASILRLDEEFRPATRAYLERLRARPGFQRADALGEALQLPGLD